EDRACVFPACHCLPIYFFAPARASTFWRARMVACVIADELLRAVLGRPDDDAPRLVYADALLDAGDLRGELIQLQCHRTPDTAAREAELIAQLEPVWRDALGANVANVWCERGLPLKIKLEVSAIKEDALAALDRAPIRDVMVALKLDVDDDDVDSHAVAEWFARDPRTARLRSLDLVWCDFEEQGLHAILAADLRRLRSLSLSDYDSQTFAADAIIKNITLSLEELRLCGDSYGDFEYGLGMLSGSPRSAMLQRLSLDNTGLGPDAGHIFARSPHFANLTELGLSGGSNTPNRLGDEGLIALASAPHLAKLRRLALVFNRITDTGLASLADPAALPALLSLAVNNCQISADGFANLVAKRAFDELYVGGCSAIGDAGVIALARSPHVRGLHCLNIAGTGVGAGGIDALIASPIERLDFLGVRVEPELRRRLVERFGPSALGEK
ncbi:MAG TPA: TIGR02996 domain-containing protein, partial [Kofleriaceae bacterium]